MSEEGNSFEGVFKGKRYTMRLPHWASLPPIQTLQGMPKGTQLSSYLMRLLILTQNNI